MRETLVGETEAGRELFLELKLVGTVRAVTSGWESGGDGDGRGNCPNYPSPQTRTGLSPTHSVSTIRC